MPLVVSKTTQNFLKTLHKPLRLSVGITIDLKQIVLIQTFRLIQMNQ